ncbi:MAG: energy-coupling factor transporter transmembrane protein EcfT [Clostridia bacterium]|nr:energy-coupling factor transporter transmembrane protein EcfT [Clostridia bacterium]
MKRLFSSGIRRGLDDAHPAAVLAYFLFALLPAMLSAHPGIQLSALIGAPLMLFCICGVRTARSVLCFAVPAALLCALINALFTHRGITVLFYFPSGNPCTLESLLSGASMAVTLLTVLCFTAMLSRIFTADKTVCLFGNISPSLALVLSMSLRFLPHYRRRLTAIRDAETGLGYALAHRHLLSRARAGLSLFSALFTVSTEESLDIADSMRARGWGCGCRRTAYALLRFTGRDAAFVSVLVLCALPLLWGFDAGALSWSYYPYPHGAQPLSASVLPTVFYFIGVFSPVLLTRYSHVSIPT